MPGIFEPLPGGGAAVALDDVEISIIRSLAVQLLELIGPGPAEDASADPLAELFAEGPSEPPSDPVLLRLFPDAYTDPEGTDRQKEQQKEYSSEFRRFTENDLRAGKRENALAVVRSLDALDADGAVLKLTTDDSRKWLGALNDLRLAIGSRLDITAEDDTDVLYHLPDDDPRKPMVMAYLWLGGLQETLVGTLMP
ncbi:DUF2017 domain-containing protein [Streptomyces acidiscabies]|uniref:DUF2017 domain-containing protein n=1 Tax=Streptomyces acidiscabies TaxID=42234 RepID=A0A0L0KL70_9ACTN|nr:DUF2017 domain-containing protein [Streptomyces acidiscabies]MBP5939352.1 DUF2017 domain-containing protein [Streptomyces sp. LBUM 1476]KND38992.1 hypothetical protein IQ63_05500 [Streptomyces acidiscabies]MBZ3910487.1 DUF2017 domain-containing protein [Streptomyces acidiscabies]MDX2959485.1 DUF2017 domain-containing protein [Streptomyces acidiscabies]MDX3019227.1 DUF2017 domain-containing protein [Streptomyces acidiscabies]